MCGVAGARGGAGRGKRGGNGAEKGRERRKRGGRGKPLDPGCARKADQGRQCARARLTRGASVRARGMLNARDTSRT